MAGDKQQLTIVERNACIGGAPKVWCHAVSCQIFKVCQPGRQGSIHLMACDVLKAKAEYLRCDAGVGEPLRW